MPGFLQHILTSRHVHWLFFIILGAALYGFTLSYPFIFDDRLYILRNPFMQQPEFFLKMLDLDNFIATYLFRAEYPDLVSSFVLRPVAYVTFYLNYSVSGNNPENFRLFNIAVHTINAILLYSVISAIMHKRIGESGLSRLRSLPFFTALIFLVHPLQTESVTYIVQRFASLGTCFYLATILLYLRSSESPTGYRKLAYVGSILTLILGMLTRESVITLPIVLLMVETILLHNTVRQAFIRLAPHIVCLCLIPLRFYILTSEAKDASLLFNVDFDSISSPYNWSDYAVTQLRVILSYVRLLLLPYNQNFDPDYPLYQNVLNPEIIISILIWSAFMIAGVRLLRRRERSVFTDLTAFSIFCFPILLSISSSFFPLSDLMSEHRTYLPSVAFFTGSVAYLHHIAIHAKFLQRNTFISGLCIVALAFAVLTVQRNKVYSSRLSMWKDTVKKSPDKARPHLLLGHTYFRKEKYGKAVKSYKKSLGLDPASVDPYLALGLTYKKMGKPEKAIKKYNQFLETNPPNAEILTDLSVAYAELGMLNEAINTLQPLAAAKKHDANLLSFFAELNVRAGNNEVANRFHAEARLADENDPTVNLTDSLDLLEKMMDKSVVERGS